MIHHEQQRRRRRPRSLVAGYCLVAAILIGGLVVVESAVVAPPRAAAQETPLDPTGRAVCNTAFTVVALLRFGSFVIPPESPLGPNDVITALSPVLNTCVGVFPPQPARQCFTSELVPTAGLPITLPDPVGIVTDQVEALVALTEPLGLALAGPLHDLFAEALQCRDASDPTADPDIGSDLVALPGPVTSTTTTSTTMLSSPTAVSAGPPVSVPTRPSDEPTTTETAAAGVGNVPAPIADLISVVPEPLRGVASVVSVLSVAALALLFRRQLSPRRRPSLLDPGPPPGG